MSVKVLWFDIVNRYISIGPYWLLFTYAATLIFTVIYVKAIHKKAIYTGRQLLTIGLFFYLITVYTSTVLSRNTVSGDLVRIWPFSSWKLALTGSKYNALQVVENVVLLVPVGVILPLIIEKKKYASKTVIFGFLFSLFIEISQFYFQVGFFKIDDLINNTLGVFMGYTFAYLIMVIVRSR